MSLSYDEIDEPLHRSEPSTNPSLIGGELTEEDAAAAKKYWEIISKIDENARKNKSHIFSMGLLIFVLVVLCTIVIVEYRVDVENEYTKDLFDSFKYLATTITGYLFASYNKKETD